jgi:hypothetical protein
MSRALIPYYVSRAFLSALFGYLISTSAGLVTGVALGGLTFLGFLWYAHSGRYLIDYSTPLFPLRRDDRGNAIRDRAVVVSVTVGGLSYLALTILSHLLSINLSPGGLAVALAIVCYFLASNWMFLKR